MNIANLIAIPALALSISGSGTSWAQDTATPSRELPYQGFRSAAGAVNFIQGEAWWVRDGKQKPSVRIGQEFIDGDEIQTGSDGRMEVLLSPGSYFRLSHNTRAVLMDLSAENLKIKLLSGSAILEMPLVDWVRPDTLFGRIVYAPITVITPRDEYAIVKGGVYRLNVDDDVSSVKVLKGLAVIAGSAVADKMTASVMNGRIAVLRVDKSTFDLFDNWSRDRSAGLIRANRGLEKADWFKKMKKDRAYLEVKSASSAEAGTRHIVSARSGFVAFVESARVLNPGEPAWQELKAGDILVNEARVRTERDCRAELHPYPNIDLYLGSSTEIDYSEKEDGHVSITVLKGSVIVISHLETKTKEQTVFTLVVDKAEYEPSARGRFRVNVPQAEPETLVYEGFIKVAGTVIKAPQRFTRAGTIRVDEEAKDSFDIWSNRRMLLPVRDSLKALVVPLGGLWLLNQPTGEYTFVPAARDYSSPYGGSYSTRYMSVGDFRGPLVPRLNFPEPGRPN